MTPEEKVAPEAGALYDSFMAHVRQGSWDFNGWLQQHFPEKPGVTDNLKQLSIFADWLNGFRPFPPAVAEQLRHLYTVGLTYNSNAIEGNTLSLQETEVVLSYGVTIGGKSLVEHLEVVGHRDAMRYMEELASSSSPLDQRVIKDLHSLIMMRVNAETGFNDAGQHRNIDVRAAGSAHTYPAHYLVPELMEGFISWLNSDEAQSLHPVELAAQVHYRFVAIHPFRDGNGRTGRLLMNLSLLRSGYPLAVIPVSERVAYINSLVHAQQNEDDLGPLTDLVASACRHSFLDYLQLLSTAADSRGRGKLFYRAVLDTIP